MQWEIFAASVAQQGRPNEDSFFINRAPVFAVLADGAGASGGCARRVVGLFEKLFREGLVEAGKPEMWERWVKVLDSSLLGTAQSTFLAVAANGGNELAGACAGDSRAYVCDEEGTLRFLTDGATKAKLGSGSATLFPIRHALASGETLLLLSDGVWTALNGDMLGKTVVAARSRDFADVPTAIIEAASKTGRRDDMTVICLRAR